MRLLTDRLVLTDITDDDLPGLLAVAHSNPDFLALSEGPDAERTYGIDALGRDLAVAALDPARHPLVLRRRAEGGAMDEGDPSRREVVGRAEVLDHHPVDGVPWIGLLEVHGELQFQGYGREAANALLAWAADRGAEALRLGVLAHNEPALVFWRRLGWVEVDRRTRDSPLGPQPVLVLERPTST